MAELRGEKFLKEFSQNLLKKFCAALLGIAPLSAVSQEAVITSPIDGSTVIVPDVKAEDVRAALGSGAELRGLDKVSGDVTEIMLPLGGTATVGKIEMTLGECRYPEDNRAGEAFAWLSIRDPRRDSLLFEGWMVASSPALNALDHARYDVWVIRCTIA